MGRVTSLTDAEVFAAIRTLLEAGSYPTAAALREHLGGRGSPVVLQRFLADWYSEHGPLLAEKAAAHRPAAAAGLRAQMQALAKEAMAEVDAAQAARVAELDRRQAGLEDREAGVAAREADLEVRTRRLDDREMAQAELLQELRHQVALATQARDAARAAEVACRTALATAEGRLSVLDGQLAQARTDLQGLAELRAEMAGTREARDHAQALLVTRTQERDAALKTRAQLEGALKDAQDAAALAQAADTEVRVALATARQRLAAEQARVEDLTKRLGALERQWVAVEAARDEAEAARRAAETALASLTGRHAAVVEERDRLANAIQASVQDRPGTTPSKPAKGTRRSPKQ